MAALDYSPNDLARSLHNRKSRLLGLIVPSSAHPFFGEIACRMEGRARELGYKVLLCNSLLDREKEREYLKMFRRNQVDGVVLAGQVMEPEEYAGFPIPAVSLDRDIAPGIPCVSEDSCQSGSLAARHLVDQGCRSLLHISESTAIPLLFRARADAFIAVCREADAACYRYEFPPPVTADFREDALFRQILERHPEADGVFVLDDIAAMAFANTAIRLGRRVPEDLKVIGYGDLPAGRFFIPSMTTIRQPVEAIAHAAVDSLIRMMDGEQVPEKTLLPVELLVRESSGRGSPEPSGS
jgi:LacI family sucrose operon transcriptional repressor